MDPKELKLPEMPSYSIATATLLRHEWVIDAPDLRVRFPDDVVKEAWRIKLQGLAEVAGLESQIKAVEARVLTETAKALSR
jgi:hypothetical protein